MLNASSLLGLLLLSALALFALAGLVIPSQSTDALALLERYAAPSAQHWLGQDELGRDVLQRLMQGGQVTLLVGLGGAALATVLGASLGLLAAVRGGWWDAALMRVTDGVMTLPLLPLLIILAAMDYSKLGLPPMLVHSELFTVLRLIVIIGLVGWTGTARLTRNAALAVLARDFVKAARALGAGDARITLRHVLPNILPMLAVAAALAVGHAILIESALSFLGVGIQPPTPSWGNMLTNAQEIVFSAPWLAIYPGLLIFLTVTACNLVAEGRG